MSHGPRRVTLREGIESLGGPVPYWGWFLTMFGCVGAPLASVGAGRYTGGPGLDIVACSILLLVAVGLGVIGGTMQWAARSWKANTGGTPTARIVIPLLYVVAAILMLARGFGDQLPMVAAGAAMLGSGLVAVLMRPRRT